MSKELEAYRRLCSHLDYDNDDYMFNGGFEEDDEVIETVLKENQDIQNCFDDYGLSIKDIREVCVSYKQREKHEKALDIIKEKNVNCELVRQTKSVIEYNKSIGSIGFVGARHCRLIQREYDLLKEVLL